MANPLSSRVRAEQDYPKRQVLPRNKTLAEAPGNGRRPGFGDHNERSAGATFHPVRGMRGNDGIGRIFKSSRCCRILIPITPMVDFA